MFRCAIYTNQNRLASIEKQRLECEKEIAKRGNEWILIEKRYDDFCNENIPALKRPGLQELFEDIETCEVNYVFVYTLDCLTTSSFELIKIANLFEERCIFFEDLNPIKISVENGRIRNCEEEEIVTITSFTSKRPTKVAAGYKNILMD